MRLGSALVGVWLFAAPALGQAKLDAEQLKTDIAGKPWMSGFVTLIAVGLVLVAAFLKSKRGHQD